jgi:protocatechuate 4,5-dioxygenase beta chain
MDSIIDDPDWLASQPVSQIIEQAGTEGVEVIHWLVMRGALDPKVEVIHKHYHVPVSSDGCAN